MRQTKEYQRLANRCWPRQTPEALVAAVFKNRRRLAEVAGELLSAEELDTLVASPPPAKTGAMTHSEFALLDEARALIDPEMRTFGHVVVDEAQNLTPMELRMVVRRARGQSLTVLGDIAQRTAEARLSELGGRARATPASTGVDDRGAARLLPRPRRLPAHRGGAGRRRGGPAGRAPGAVAGGDGADGAASASVPWPRRWPRAWRARSAASA